MVEPRNAAPFPVEPLRGRRRVVVADESLSPTIVVVYGTSLRSRTLDALSVPEHCTRGASPLTITDEIDEARFGREVPLGAEV